MNVGSAEVFKDGDSGDVQYVKEMGEVKTV